MEQQQPGLGGFPGFQGKQKQRQNTNPNAAFNRPVGMMPNQGLPQAPPPVQNQLPVNPQMNRPTMPMRPQRPMMSQVPATNLQDVLMRLRNRSW
jgi:hypothetical protein